MRFGIMTLQKEMLIPSHLSPAEAAAHVASLDHAKVAEGLCSSGFDLLELSGDMALFVPHSYSPATIERLAELKRQQGLTYTVHLPLWSVEPSTPLGPVRQGSARALLDCLEATLPLEPEVYVLHATGSLAAEFYRMDLPEMARGLILRQFQACARDSIRFLLTESGLPSRRLAIETIEFPFDLTLELAEEMDLSICLDTGHVLVGFSGPWDLFDVLEQSLPRLAEIHLNDGPWQGPERVIGYGQDHWPLGRGDLDVTRLLERLIAAGFSGPLVLEMAVHEAHTSLEVIKSTRPELLRR